MLDSFFTAQPPESSEAINHESVTQTNQTQNEPFQLAVNDTQQDRTTLQTTIDTSQIQQTTTLTSVLLQDHSHQERKNFNENPTDNDAMDIDDEIEQNNIIYVNQQSPAFKPSEQPLVYNGTSQVEVRSVPRFLPLPRPFAIPSQLGLIPTPPPKVFVGPVPYPIPSINSVPRSGSGTTLPYGTQFTQRRPNL